MLVGLLFRYKRVSTAHRKGALGDQVIVSITPTIYRPVSRRRDGDNFWAGMKSALDGVANALEVDDSRFALMPINWEKGEDRTVLTIEVRE